MKKTPSKEQINQIVSRIDKIPGEDLANELIRLNPNSRKEFADAFLKAVDQTPEEGHATICSSIHKGLLKKNPPIISMLQYFKTIYHNIDKIRDIIISKDVHIDIDNESYTITANLLEFEARICHLRSMINTLVMDIEGGYDATITVDLNNSKELLLSKFKHFISTELSKSPIYGNRKKIRLQPPQKLRQYIKVWELKRIGLNPKEIAPLINEQVATVKKQFRKAFELIYECEYSKENFTKIVTRRGNKKTCDGCPKKEDGCKVLCKEAEDDAHSYEKPLREKLYGNSSMANTYLESDDFLGDDNWDIEDETDTATDG
jgi:hypothetical protein